MWDLSSPTRDGTHIPCTGRWILYHWTTREVLPCYLLIPSLPSSSPQILTLKTYFQLVILLPTSQENGSNHKGTSKDSTTHLTMFQHLYSCTRLSVELFRLLSPANSSSICVWHSESFCLPYSSNSLFYLLMFYLILYHSCQYIILLFSLPLYFFLIFIYLVALGLSCGMRAP